MKGSTLTAAVCDLSVAAAVSAQRGPSIATDDGLVLGLGQEGRVAAIRLDGREVPLVQAGAKGAAFRYRNEPLVGLRKRRR